MGSLYLPSQPQASHTILTLNILSSWSYVSRTPGNVGTPVIISTKMQPTPHMSRDVEYSVLPSKTSGGRYHSVTTSCEYVCEGTDFALARPEKTSCIKIKAAKVHGSARCEVQWILFKYFMITVTMARCAKIRVWFPVGAGNSSLLHCIQTSSGAHQAYYPMCTRGCFTRGKVAEAWSWPLTSSQCWGQECMVLYLHPQIHLVVWCLVKHRENFTLPYIFKLETPNEN